MDSRQCVLLQLGGWVGRLTTLPHKTQYSLQNTMHSLGSGQIICYWIRLAQDRDQWRAVASAVMNRRVPAPRSLFVS
jgi:hypothetical protein